MKDTTKVAEALTSLQLHLRRDPSRHDAEWRARLDDLRVAAEMLLKDADPGEGPPTTQPRLPRPLMDPRRSRVNVDLLTEVVAEEARRLARKRARPIEKEGARAAGEAMEALPALEAGEALGGGKEGDCEATPRPPARSKTDRTYDILRALRVARICGDRDEWPPTWKDLAAAAGVPEATLRDYLAAALDGDEDREPLKEIALAWHDARARRAAEARCRARPAAPSRRDRATLATLRKTRDHDDR